MTSPSEITFLKSPSHDVLIKYNEDKTQAFLEFDHSNGLVYPNKDFYLFYANKDVNQPQYTLAKNSNDPTSPFAAQITFFPNFNEKVELK